MKDPTKERINGIKEGGRGRGRKEKRNIENFRKDIENEQRRKKEDRKDRWKKR